MDDRRASWVAAALGGIAIAGFGFARPAKPHVALRVLGQWTPVTREGPDGDAAVLIRIDPRSAMPEDERPITYRIMGADGSGYPLVPSSAPNAGGILKLTKGYGHRLDSPRLVASLGDQSLVEIPLRPIPTPAPHALIPSANPPVLLVLRGESDLFAEPCRPLPPDERWRVVARRTPFVEGLNASSDVARAGAHSIHRLFVPFPKEAGLVEVDLMRYRLVPESDVVQLKGLRLLRRFGGTALIVDRPMRIPNRLGADIRLPKQDNGPRHAVRNGDHRIAMTNLILTPPWFLKLPPELRRGRGPTVELIRPAPESLGLRELRIASQSGNVSRNPGGPLREGPFCATVRITFYRPVAIETRRMVLPITVGAPLPFPLAAFASRDSAMR